ncbi:hypothetical protein GON03_10205 [Nocardioides sp. MAH-18]|uniref:ESX secretion-associated protein EspG n=1 Tax=Nocardioides agri TaxID=2682843 RepID=A0A6L6XRW6_9ACTN|nr:MULTISPECIES: hypothetical protein [unclassified Nocardioides]MBA2954696.1 hypothetical protein [Nocardioides sp. CGMCC 1.13656]MVQ49552.1 hypothetical protein [Nocardioides sp. MAH-18]
MTPPHAGPATEPVFVEVLTDEELAVLSTPGPMPVTPYLRDLDPAHADTARRTAYRSLVARGIVDAPTPEPIAAATAASSREVELMVRQDVRSVVALREAAQVVVAVARTAAAAQDFWYAHVVDDVVLLEEVSRDGMHRFALAETEWLLGPEGLAAAAAVHPDAGDRAEGPDVAVEAEAGDPTPPPAVLEALGESFVRADVVVRRPGDTEPPAFALFTGPAGCWCVEAAQPPLVARPVTAEQARGRVADAVGAVRAEAVTLGRG